MSELKVVYRMPPPVHVETLDVTKDCLSCGRRPGLMHLLCTVHFSCWPAVPLVGLERALLCRWPRNPTKRRRPENRGRYRFKSMSTN